jgi:prepilin-type N-terminal cleavage/methylation domain-containing protein
MKNPKRNGQHGFSMIELLLVLIVVGLLAAILVPEFRNSLERAKMRGAASEVVGLMRLARLDAIKHSRDAIVVYDPAGPDGASAEDNVARMIACPDVNANRICDGGTAEPLLGRYDLPVGVFARDEAGNLGADSVLGFTAVPSDPALPRVAVFQRDGSVAVRGGFHFGDACATGNNVLGVRVVTEATARIETLKWRPSPSRWEAAGDGANGQAWQWYSAACTEAP